METDTLSDPEKFPRHAADSTPARGGLSCLEHGLARDTRCEARPHCSPYPPKSRDGPLRGCPPSCRPSSNQAHSFRPPEFDSSDCPLAFPLRLLPPAGGAAGVTSDSELTEAAAHPAPSEGGGLPSSSSRSAAAAAAAAAAVGVPWSSEALAREGGTPHAAGASPHAPPAGTAAPDAAQGQAGDGTGD